MWFWGRMFKEGNKNGWRSLLITFPCQWRKQLTCSFVSLSPSFRKTIPHINCLSTSFSYFELAEDALTSFKYFGDKRSLVCFVGAATCIHHAWSLCLTQPSFPQLQSKYWWWGYKGAHEGDFNPPQRGEQEKAKRLICLHNWTS